jgi:hypothetical protein
MLPGTRTISYTYFALNYHNKKILYGIFHEDSEIAHMAHAFFEAKQEVFNNRVNSHGLWPPHSPELTASDFYL